MKFITGNSNKLREVQAILGNHIIQWDIDLPEIQSLDSQEVLNHKIQSTLDSLNETEKQIPFFLEDTSLTFHALGKFP